MIELEELQKKKTDLYRDKDHYANKRVYIDGNFRKFADKMTRKGYKSYDDLPPELKKTRDHYSKRLQDIRDIEKKIVTDIDDIQNQIYLITHPPDTLSEWRQEIVDRLHKGFRTKDSDRLIKKINILWESSYDKWKNISASVSRRDFELIHSLTPIGSWIDLFKEYMIGYCSYCEIADTISNGYIITEKGYEQCAHCYFCPLHNRLLYDTPIEQYNGPDYYNTCYIFENPKYTFWQIKGICSELDTKETPEQIETLVMLVEKMKDAIHETQSFFLYGQSGRWEWDITTERIVSALACLLERGYIDFR